MKKLYATLLIGILSLSGYAQQTPWTSDFSKQDEALKVIGRGDCYISNGVLHSQSAYACFGHPEWKNYSVSFKARAPQEAEQVQIWAGFRAHNRFDRYIVGIKGGLQDDIYLTRLGYMGTDEFMGVRPLGFHPVPGEWYKIKVEVCGNRIRVFLNDEKLPRIDVVDKNSRLAPAGEVTLGGGWIETEFDDLVITPMNEDALNNIKQEEYIKVATPQEKERKRQLERAQYKSITVDQLVESRTDISLDGDWLFMPDYQLKDKNKAIAAETNDQDWHVMRVPSFWTPIRIWLHGETMSSPNGPQPKGVSDTYYQQETERCEAYTFNYKKVKYAWYRQWVELPQGIEGKNLTLTFDAVSKASEVYINGELTASYIGMFGEFQADGSKLFKPGKNLVVVKVSRALDESESSADDLNNAIDFYYSSVREEDKVHDTDTNLANNILSELAHGFYGDNPAGIWQPVKLTITDPLKVEDVFIKPALTGATFDVTIKNHAGKKQAFNLYTDIVDKETGGVLYTALSLPKLTLKPGEEQLYTYSVDVLKPRLWTPQHPNLYDFKFRLVADKGAELDQEVITSGFRTFEVKEGLFWLNGNRYTLRGGNHTPFALAPNDLNLANTFYQWMKAGHIDVTRTHTTPYNKLWMNAADTNGIGISFEGTWSWLMIHGTMPHLKLIEMWKVEYLSLIKKYRNHPSLLFWTVNNEMKFYDNDNDLERAKRKFQIISDVVKEMRKIDPTRPISFDSNYFSRGKKEKFGEDFMASVDDGDIDDVHGYYNWYDYSLFRFFNGEFQKFKMPGRPLISQEMSTGYPNNETGHPTRSYQLIHQNPQSLIGYECYDFANPQSFLNTQAFITGELAEAFRRSNDQGSGTLHFALLTWFRQVYNYQKIEPYPTYYALKRAMQPVLVSAELWGRNLYAGEKLNTRFYVVNDKEDGTDLQPTLLRWELQDETGKKLASGSDEFPAVKHYMRHYIERNIQLPNRLPSDKVKAKLVLKLSENGLPVSENEYNLLLVQKAWNMNKVHDSKKIVLLDKDGAGKVFDFLNINYQAVSTIKDMLNTKLKADLCVISGLEDCTDEERDLIRSYQAKGGKLLFLNSKGGVKKIYPKYIAGWIIPTEGDIVFMERNDAPVFEDIDVLELRYFNNNKREMPTACNATLIVNRNENVIELAGQMKIHAYLDEKSVQERVNRIGAMRGFTLLEIKEGKGEAMVSTICTEKATTDPVAGKLLVNMINKTIK